MSNKWDTRFMELTKTIAKWSSCSRPNRQIGAIIVKNKRILTTGYNGAPSGVQNCFERDNCIRDELKIESGTKQEICYANHAEQNAICQAAFMGIQIAGATLYCTHQPCAICAKMIINAGIVRVVFGEGYPDNFALELLNEANILIEQFMEIENE